MRVQKHYAIKELDVKVGKLGLLTWFVRCYRRLQRINLQLYLDYFYFNVIIFSQDFHTVRAVRKSDPDPANPQVVMSLDGYGSDASITQMKLLLTLKNSISLWKAQKRGVVEERLETSGSVLSQAAVDDEFLKTQLSSMQGANLIPVMISPSVFPPHTRTCAPQTPPYIHELYEILDKKFPGIYRNFADSWISTGNVNGVVTALTSMIRPQAIKVPNKDVHMSLIRILHASGYKTSMRIAAPVLTQNLLKAIPVPMDKKSGIVLAKREVHNYRHVTINYTNTPIKSKLLDVELGRFNDIIGDIYHEVRDAFNNDGSIHWAHNVFPIMVNKFAEKPEVRQRGEDPEKVRIFFLVSLLKFLMDSVVHIPFHQLLRRGYSYSIGHKWPGGGAEELAREMNGWDPDWRWIWWDASKLDQSIVATLIVIICMLSLIVYEPGTIDYVILANIAAFCADQTGGKYVTWMGKYCRFVIGVIFSGDLNTSHLGSLVMGSAVECAVIDATREQKKLALQGDSKAQEFLSKVSVVCKENIITKTRICRAGHPLHYSPRVYGDDGLMGMHKHIHAILTMERLTKYMEDNFNIKLKASACGTSDKFFAKVTPDGNVATSVPDGPRPCLLKRYFVLAKIPQFVEPVVLAFRPREDYDVRIGRTAQSIDDKSIEYARLVGLMWDTMGTNVVAWELLNMAADIVASWDKDVESKITEAMSCDDDNASVELRTRKKALMSVLGYSRKIDFSPDLSRRPQRGEVFLKYLPSDIASRCEYRWSNSIKPHSTIWAQSYLDVDLNVDL